MNPRNFFAELKRRNVYKVAVAYAVVAWLLVQAASILFPTFEAPPWVMKVFVALVALGFPLALIFAWAFELTPEGIKRTEDVAPNESITRRTGRKLMAGVAVVAVTAAALLVFQLVRPNPQASSTASAVATPASSTIPDKSIAVLPFDSLSEEKANAYFADGIQDQILTKLASIADLKVISRTSTAKYKTKPEDLKVVSRELGVANVLEGTVQRAGEKVRVNVQLIDARADSHLWAKSYDRDLKDVFAIQSEVAQEIADALQAKLSPRETSALAAAPTRNTEAYDLFLRAEYEHRHGESALNAEQLDKAADLYREALARDPTFALAWARLAITRLTRHWYIANFTQAELDEVKSFIDRAFSLARDLPEGHLARGLFHYWGARDYEPALAELARTLELQPNNANARAYRAWVYRRQGRWEEALAESIRAAELDPRDPAIPINYGGMCVALRRWADAERALLRGLALDPHSVVGAWNLANSYIGAGDIGRARRAYEAVPPHEKLNINARGNVSSLIDERVYLDVIERKFPEALAEWADERASNIAGRPRQLAARVAIRSIAGDAAAAKVDAEEARPLLEARMTERPDDIVAQTGLAWVYLALGRDAEALATMRKAAALLPPEKDALSGPIVLLGVAEIQAHTGQSRDAVATIRRLLSIPCQSISLPRVRIDPVWDPIRNDPEFQKLLSQPEPKTQAR